MPIDNSTGSPGQMGWGLATETIAQRHYAEKLHFENLANAHPLMLMPRAPRTPDTFIEAKIKAAMQADGIEDGWSCMHIEKAVFGKWLQWLAQIIGSCVASGGARCDTWAMLQQKFLFSEPEDIFGSSLVGVNNVCPFAPFSYRAGRKLGNINGNSDGSYCAVHLRGKKEFGILPCYATGLSSDAFPEPQSPSLYRQWGASDALLNQFASQAIGFKLAETGLITNADAGKKIVVERRLCSQICSDWAFRPKEQHPTWKLSDGTPVWIYERDTSTSWAHNISIVAIVLVSGKWYVIVVNSWGMKAHKNGMWFAIPIEVYAKWCTDSEQMYVGDFDLTDTTLPI